MAPVANPADVSVVAQIESPDLLSAGPDGSLFTGGLDGAVRRISKEGDVTTLRSGFLQPRGTAYDAGGKRLFFANHDGASGSTPHHTIEIIPVE